MTPPRTKPSEGPIRFRGVPASLTAVVPGGVDPLADYVVTFRPGKGDPLEVPVQADLDPRVLRMTLPSPVEAGDHEGTIEGGGRSERVRVEVDPAPALRVFPEQLRIRAHPGDLVGTDLTLINTGNVPLKLRRVQPFGIFREGGLERALRRAYVEKVEGDRRRVDVIADNLADAHGGLVKMRIRKGSGSVPPEGMRQLELDIEIPRGLARGSVYSGNWELPGLVFPVTLTIAESDESPSDSDEE